MATSSGGFGSIGVPEILVVFVVIVGLVLYFTPSIVALRRQKRNSAGILLVNFFFGWTVIGWVGALVWAVSTDSADVAAKATSAEGPTRQCPHCAETIKAAAKVCKHCGRDLPAMRVVGGVVLDEGFK